MRVFASEASRRMAHNLDDLLERWHLRRETKTPKKSKVTEFIPAQVEKKYEPPEFFTDDEIRPMLEVMTIAELDQLESEALAQLEEVKLNLSIAGQEGVTTGRWVSEATFIRKRLHCLNHVIGSVRSGKKRLVKHKTRGFAEIFTDLAREKLPLDIFEPLELEAKEIAKAELAALADAELAKALK